MPADALASVEAVAGVAKPDPILVVDDVQRRYGGLLAVDVEHLEVPRGVICSLIGPNGAGKTTFFNLLCGFDKADAGRWTFEGERADGHAQPGFLMHLTPQVVGQRRARLYPAARRAPKVADPARIGVDQQKPVVPKDQGAGGKAGQARFHGGRE